MTLARCFQTVQVACRRTWQWHYGTSCLSAFLLLMYSVVAHVDDRSQDEFGGSLSVNVISSWSTHLTLNLCSQNLYRDLTYASPCLDVLCEWLWQWLVLHTYCCNNNNVHLCGLIKSQKRTGILKWCIITQTGHLLLLYSRWNAVFHVQNRNSVKFGQNYAYRNPILLQLPGDFVPQIPYRGFAPGPHWGTSASQTPCTGRPPHFVPGLRPYAQRYNSRKRETKNVDTNKC